MAVNKKTFLLIFLVFGVFLRFAYLSNTIFGWDQAHSVAFAAKEIVSGQNFPLIGAKTGVGDLYLTSLYAYLLTPFFLVFGLSPIAVPLSAAFFAAFFILISFISISKIIDRQTGLIFSSLWSVSTLIVYYDRIPWNVNLYPFASLLVFLGMWFFSKNKYRVGWIYILLGWIIGASSHFSFIYLYLVVFLYLIFRRKISIKTIFTGIAFLLMSIFPLILFDLKNSFFLVRNSLHFFASSTGTFWENFRLFEVLKIISSIVGRLIFYDIGIWASVSIGFIFFLAVFYKRMDKTVNNYFKILIIFLLTYLLGYSLYKGDLPEYYFIGLFPVIGVGIAILIRSVFAKTEKYIVIVLLLAVLFLRSFYLIKETSFDSLEVKSVIAQKIKEKSDKEPISIIYDMDLGRSFGFDYIFDYYKIRIDEKSDEVFWLSSPKDSFSLKADFVEGDFALGFPQTTKYIYLTKNVDLYGGALKLRVPSEWSIIRCSGNELDKYLLTFDENASCKNFSIESQGIAVFNIGNCNIGEIKNKTKVDGVDNNMFFLVNPGTIKNEIYSDFFQKFPLVLTEIEKRRCLVFAELQSLNNSYSSSFLDIINNAKK